MLTYSSFIYPPFEPFPEFVALEISFDLLGLLLAVVELGGQPLVGHFNQAPPRVALQTAYEQPAIAATSFWVSSPRCLLSSCNVWIIVSSFTYIVVSNYLFLIPKKDFRTYGNLFHLSQSSTSHSTLASLKAQISRNSVANVSAAAAN